MASWGSVDISGMRSLQTKLAQLEQGGIDAFATKAAKMLAARLLAKVIRRTPVGVYTNGQVGGTLRRGWTAGAGNVGGFVNGLNVRKQGNTYEVTISNNTNYAAFVEFGHRTRGGGFVPGRFMLTISEDEVRAQAQTLLNRELDKLLREVFGGN